MKPDLWMPVYIGDYLRDTTHLTAAEHGAYLLLLFHGWLNEGHIPLDESLLARIAGLPPKRWKKARAAILPFFVKGETFYYQKRQVEELARARENQAKCHARAVAGGQGTKQAWGRLQACLPPGFKSAPSPSPAPNNKSSTIPDAIASRPKTTPTARVDCSAELKRVEEHFAGKRP